MSFRDRLASLSRAELLGLAVLLAVTLGGAGLWYTRSLPRPVEIGAPSPSVGATGAPISASPSPSPATIIVDVAGRVKKPGVYEFADGDRVIDAVNAAGGPRKDADLTSLNLAAPLSDGAQVLVPQEASATPAGSTTGSTSAPGGTTLININTAPELELENLPGVGPVLGAAIVQYRTENGAFSSVDDLLDVSGIGPATLEEIRPMATV